MASATDWRSRIGGWLQRESRVTPPRQVLVVDAVEGSRAHAGVLLTALGYAPLLVSTQADAVAALETEDPTFLLLGFTLDDGDGLTALGALREVAPEVPIAMLAPSLWDPRVAEAMRRGAVAYLAPPFGADDLRELLGRS